MRVKIGNTWHIATPGKAIMVELTEKDKRNISLMRADSCYAEFHEEDGRTKDQMRKWMDKKENSDEAVS